MNIQPAKDYKKPLYAIGLAATVMLTGVTGCRKGEERVQLMGDTTVSSVEPDYGGETTVVNPPQAHANTEYDVSPYQVKDADFYLRTKAQTSTDDLVRFSASKLDRITKTDDVFCEGRYQDYDFKIIRTDKYLYWITNNEHYKDTSRYDGGYYVEYVRNSAESDMLPVYHDPSERFMVITDCCDDKIIYEFFTSGNAETGENGEPAESTEFTGNKEFPRKYEAFCLEEFHGRIMEARYALRWSKENHVVVFEDSKCVSGKDMWEAFIYSYRTKNKASVLIADYHSADKKKKQSETLDFYWIHFERRDDSDYCIISASIRRSDSKEAGKSCYCQYLKHFSGTDDIYVITDDKELTLEEAEKLKFGLEDGEYPELCAIRFKKEEKKKK